MTQNKLIELAKRAGAMPSSNPDEYDVLKINIHELEAFAKLILLNNPPQSFMSWQEGYDAGRHAATKGFCEKLRLLHDSYSLAADPKSIRARGQG